MNIQGPFTSWWPGELMHIRSCKFFHKLKRLSAAHWEAEPGASLIFMILPEPGPALWRQLALFAEPQECSECSELHSYDPQAKYSQTSFGCTSPLRQPISMIWLAMHQNVQENGQAIFLIKRHSTTHSSVLLCAVVHCNAQASERSYISALHRNVLQCKSLLAASVIFLL